MSEKTKTDLLQEVIRWNRELQQKAREWNTRAGEQVFPVWNKQQWEEWLAERLGGAVSVATIPDLEVLRLPDLDEGLIQLILQENPDNIEVLGQTCKMEYVSSSARLRIDFRGEQARDWQKLPDEIRLPGGREVALYSAVEGYGHYIEAKSSLFKEKVREHLNQGQWDAWRERPAIPAPDPADDAAAIPEIITVEYGKCVVTGEPLVAFGTVWGNKGYWDSTITWKTAWYQTRAEAEAKLEQAKAEFEKAKVEAREKRERETAKAEAEAAKQELGTIRSREGYAGLEYDLRRRVDDRRNSYLPSSSQELAAWTAETKALIAEVEAGLSEVARKREEEERLRREAEARRAQGGKRLSALLNRLVSTCPICGQSLEWDEDQCETALEYGSLNLPCQCYPNEFLGSTIAAIEAGVVGESIDFERRIATVLKRLEVAGKPAVQFVLYYKYGTWNYVGVLDVDAAVAEGKAKLVEVWHEPTETETRLAQLRQMAETYEADLPQAEGEVAAGYSYKLSFRKGVHPKTGEEQWEAGGKKSPVKFVLDRHSNFPVAEGKVYFCREKRTLVDLPKFRLVLVEVYLEANRDLGREIAELEAKLFAEKKADNEAESKAKDNPSSEEEPRNGGEDMASKLAALRKKWGA